jgi:hypothetical protein
LILELLDVYFLIKLYFKATVMNQIQEREIWIPYGEVKRYNLSKIGKWFRKIESEWESQIPNSEKKQVLEEK